MRGGGPWGGRRRHWAVPEGTAHVGLAQNRVSWERRVWGRGPRSPRRAGPGHLHMGLRTLRGARKRAGAWGVTVSMTQDCVGQLGPAVSPGPRRPPCVHMHNLGDGQRRGRHGPRGRPPTPSREPCLLAPSPAQSRWARGPEESSARAESRAVTEAGRTGWVRLSKSPASSFTRSRAGTAGQGPRRDRDPVCSRGIQTRLPAGPVWGRRGGQEARRQAPATGPSPPSPSRNSPGRRGRGQDRPQRWGLADPVLHESHTLACAGAVGDKGASPQHQLPPVGGWAPRGDVRGGLGGTGWSACPHAGRGARVLF